MWMIDKPTYTFTLTVESSKQNQTIILLLKQWAPQHVPACLSRALGHAELLFNSRHKRHCVQGEWLTLEKVNYQGILGIQCEGIITCWVETNISRLCLRTCHVAREKERKRLFVTLCADVNLVTKWVQDRYSRIF